MLSTTLIDIAIGLILTYLVLALVCVSISEAIGSAMRLRARVLYNEISRLLQGSGLDQSFWQTGLIRSMSRPGAATVRSGQAPSYLHASTFVAALFSAARLAQAPGDGTPVHQEPKVRALLQGVDEQSMLGQVLYQIADAADQEVDTVRGNVEAWFDQAMERTSGVFKRRMQLISFLIAVAVCAVVNADTIQIARTLWTDGALRSQLSSLAADKVAAGDLPDTMRSLEDVLVELRPLPFGWAQAVAAPPVAGATPMTVLVVIYKIAGLAISAFAVSLGAPFWFDLLSRFVSIRGAGPGKATDSAPIVSAAGKPGSKPGAQPAG
ncbi:hypothetical protein [Chachezhania sediminis]|uniref:hypothetical protein n=1 Tax=Chachezhania sediminis TaxID=2599291 RepID=UPI00131B189F|nr:hypothetical protein [Chachezhania sediminis]